MFITLLGLCSGILAGLAVGGGTLLVDVYKRQQLVLVQFLSVVLALQ